MHKFVSTIITTVATAKELKYSHLHSSLCASPNRQAACQMKNGRALRSIDSSFKQRYTQYYLALNTSLLSVSVHQLRCCPSNRTHKNNRAIPQALTEADLFRAFDQPSDPSIGSGCLFTSNVYNYNY